METGNSMFVNAILIIIVLHFIVGFAFLVKKLSGKPIEEEDEINENDQETKK